MSHALTLTTIARAEAGPIDGRTLHHLRNVAYDMRDTGLTEADGCLLILCLGPVLDELIEYRRRAAEGIEIGSNVLPFPVQS